MSKQLTPTESLALTRTFLANERTLLSYIRTTVGLLAIGGSLVKFLSGPDALFLGIIFLISGLATLIFGVIHYLQVDSHLRTISSS